MKKTKQQFEHDAQNALAIIKNMANASLPISDKLASGAQVSPTALALFKKSLHAIIQEAEKMQADIVQLREDNDD